MTTLPEHLQEACNGIEFKKDLDSDFFRNLRQYDGGRYSVTSILSIVSMGFLDGIFANIPKEQSKKSMDNGTLLHEEIEESYKQGKFIPSKSLQSKAWLKFWTSEGMKWKPVSLEEKLLGEGVGGTADAIMNIGKKVYMVDWKTAKSSPTGTFLLKYKMQLGIYAKMWMDKHQEGINEGKIVLFLPAGNYKILTYSKEELYKFYKDFLFVQKEFYKLLNLTIKPMKLLTNVNLTETAVIEKSSIITGRNGSGKSSILNSIEMSLYGTVGGVRPKSKGLTEFTSDYSFRAKELNIADIINCRFLELAPMDKRKILLELIVDDEIQTAFGTFWSGNVTDSIKAVKDKTREFKKAIDASELNMKILQDQNEVDQEKLKEYPADLKVDFEFKDETKLISLLGDLKGLMDSSAKAGQSLVDKKCGTCNQSLPKQEGDELTLKNVISDYERYKKDYSIKYAEWEDAVKHNKGGEKAAANKIMLAEKTIIENNIKGRDSDISGLVEKLGHLQDEGVFAVSNFVDNDLFPQITKKFSLEGFKLDLEKGFKLTYKDNDYATMSRGQKYACSIYFSIGLLKQLGCLIICIDDFEMINEEIRNHIVGEIEDFDYLIGKVNDGDLTIN